MDGSAAIDGLNEGVNMVGRILFEARFTWVVKVGGSAGELAVPAEAAKLPTTTAGADAEPDADTVAPPPVGSVSVEVGRLAHSGM